MSVRADDPPKKPAITSGLVMFGRHPDPAARRRRQIFVAIYGVVALMIVWPVFSFFAGAQPLILGLPLSFAWVVLALLVIFAALVWLFRTDDHGESGDSRGRS